MVVGREVFYSALWGSVLASPAVRLPASLFVVGHINHHAPGKEQKFMLGTDYQLTVGAVCLAGARAWLPGTGLSLSPWGWEQQGKRRHSASRVCLDELGRTRRKLTVTKYIIVIISFGFFF